MTDGSAAPIAARAPGTYYGATYWNNLDYVRYEINRRISGSPGVDWATHFARRHPRKFASALSLNCGNGWVERTVYDLGIVERAVGVDIDPILLDQAREHAGGRPLTYQQLDINAAAFPGGGWDMVINHAAGHHMAYVDRIFRALAELMAPDGLLVSFDYVGAHRNQYPREQWNAARGVNRRLPRDLRQDLHYPHLRTMLATDPSEAIHPELLDIVMARYFRVLERQPVGGAIAYLLLTHNQRVFTSRRKDLDDWLALVMDEDAAYLASHPQSSMFDYWVAAPVPAEQWDPTMLRQFTAEEERRERTAARHGGRYYRPTSVALWNSNVLRGHGDLHTRLRRQWTRLRSMRE